MLSLERVRAPLQPCMLGSSPALCKMNRKAFPSLFIFCPIAQPGHRQTTVNTTDPGRTAVTRSAVKHISPPPLRIGSLPSAHIAAAGRVKRHFDTRTWRCRLVRSRRRSLGRRSTTLCSKPSRLSTRKMSLILARCVCLSTSSISGTVHITFFSCRLSITSPWVA